MIGSPPEKYDREAFEGIIREIERALEERFSRLSNVETGSIKVILTSPNGTRYALKVDDAGVVGSDPA